jgi:hypothetical protein
LSELTPLKQCYHAVQKPDQLQSRRAASKESRVEKNFLNHSSANPSEIGTSIWHDWFHFQLLHPSLDLQGHILGIEAGEM